MAESYRAFPELKIAIRAKLKRGRHRALARACAEQMSVVARICSRLLLAFAVSSSAHSAERYPSRPIRFVVPFAPGGPADIAARTIAVKGTELLGQTIVVDNRAGGGGIAGTEIVAKSKPDGYTILLCSTSVMVINPIVTPNVPYDPLRDLTPVSLVMSGPYLLLVNASSGAKSVKDLIASAKAKPGSMNFGSAGIGSAAHLVAEIFRSSAGIDVVHVPYKGSGPAAIDLIAGNLQFVFEAVASSLPNVNAGRLRALGVSTRERFPLTPQIPTVNESGLPGFEAATWQGVCAPPNMPKPVLTTLNHAIAQAARAPESVERLAGLGAQAIGSSPDEFLAFVKTEIPRWSKAIRASGAKAQ